MILVVQNKSAAQDCKQSEVNMPLNSVAKLEISDWGVERIYPKVSIKPWGENVHTQKFLYENYILSTTERKVRGVDHSRPYYGTPLPLMSLSQNLNG
ncbi:hypothetical protein Hanom_Chr15g01390281 [Helianthus anomalus]